MQERVTFQSGMRDLFQATIYPDEECVSRNLTKDGLIINTFPFVIGRMPNFEESRPAPPAQLELDDIKPYRISRYQLVLGQSQNGLVAKDPGSKLGNLINGKLIGGGSDLNLIELPAGEHQIRLGGEKGSINLTIRLSKAN